MSTNREDHDSPTEEPIPGSSSINDLLELLDTFAKLPSAEQERVRQYAREKERNIRHEAEMNPQAPGVTTPDDTTETSQDDEFPNSEDEGDYDPISEASTISWLLDQYADFDDEALSELFEFHDAEERLQEVLTDRAYARYCQGSEDLSRSEVFMPNPESQLGAFIEEEGEVRGRGIVGDEAVAGAESETAEGEYDEMGSGPYADGFRRVGRDVDEIQIAALVTAVLFCGIWVLEEGW
jgi:hypothetical protein